MAHKDRKKPRSIVRFSGLIIDGDHPSVDCMVVDLSVTGARIHLAEKDNLPQKFILHVIIFPDIPPLAIKGRRVWRNRELAGVHFESLSRRDYAVMESIIKIHRGELKQPEQIKKEAAV
jgi:hypothetical protein